jgi:hypothetical protein
VPFTDLEAHFNTLLVVARMPKYLRDRVIVEIKAKPGPLGEDPILYSKLCGFSEESVSFTDNLKFSECLELADCAVGINVPTNGYYEVIERGVPLIHIQTTDAVTYHPDLPDRIVRTVRTGNAIWPTINAVLFDSLHRQRLIVEQSRFLESEQRTSFWRSTYSHREALRRLSRRRRAAGIKVRRTDVRNRRIDLARRLQRKTKGILNIDDILLDSQGNGGILGWAADRTTNRVATAVHIYANTEWLAGGEPGLWRPDVVTALGNPAFIHAGFAIEIPNLQQYADQTISAYAELTDGSFYKLSESWQESRS